MRHDLPSLPCRPEDGHKGTFGTVCVIGGQCGNHRMMIGGPAFTATAALRVGCGLVALAMPEPILGSGLEIAPSATGIALPVEGDGSLNASKAADVLDRYAGGASCYAVGPGLGAGDAQQQIMVRLIAQDAIPLVVDADGLNALSEIRAFQRDFRANAILTPHPGEFRRLATMLSIEHDPIDPRSRDHAATALAQRLGCVVVLKGHRTVVADGVDTWSNPTGNVALATAGTGDVLTGVIAGLVAQFFKSHLGMTSRQVTPEQQGGLSLFDCARLGALLHGKAADMWAEKNGDAGLLASELLDHLPAVLSGYRVASRSTSAST